MNPTEKRLSKTHSQIKERVKELETMFKVIDQRTTALTRTMIKFSEELKK